MHTIQHWTEEANRIAQEVKEMFGHLQAEQVNWKPDPERWSVGQCIDHLMVTNATYFPIIKSIAAGTKVTTRWEKIPYLPAFFGKALIKSFQPEAQSKLQSPKIFKPSSSAVHPDVIAHFVNHQQELIELINQTEGVDHQRVIITSPASKFVTYSLRDAFNIILVHERRHVVQAKGVMANEHFPNDAPLSNE